MHKDLYTNYLKNREFGKKAPQNFRLEQATIASRQGAREDKHSEKKLTQSKTDPSSSLCIQKNPGKLCKKTTVQSIAYLYKTENIYFFSLFVFVWMRTRCNRPLVACS